MDIVYTLTVIYNFINLKSFKAIKDKEINKENIRLVKAESNVVIN